jgi:peptidoglycan/LPS O-acetylase OafA/YrhL
MKTSHPYYRPDIDGLRAIAILSVLGFHFFPNTFKGGFIGVDIFFVISGFLISSIILMNLEGGHFSLIDFYKRRVRRIFPALLVVTTVSLFFGFFLLYWDEYAKLGKHVASGLAFISNFILAKGANYFDSDIETKPMVHLWSLAVEEQFYILWPLLLIFLYKRKLSIPHVTFAIGTLSFVFALYFVLKKPTAAFYYPTSRFWELMVGGFLAYLHLHKKPGPHPSELKSQFGLALIIMGIFMINKDTIFPGFAALLPTFGAFFLISGGPHTLINRHLLSNRYLVWIGLISYPLYLWHWPMIAFMRVVIGQEPSMAQKMIIIFLSFVLAWLTYFFIEKNIRKKTSKISVPLLLWLAVFICAVSLAIKINQGLPNRPFNQKIKYMANSNKNAAKIFDASRRPDKSCQKLNQLTVIKSEVCLSNSAAPQTLLAGDSHAMALYSSIHSKEIQLEAILISAHGCQIYPQLFSPSVTKNSWGNDCQSIAHQVIEAAKALNTIQTVVLVNHYPFRSDEADRPSIYHSEKLLNDESAPKFEDFFNISYNPIILLIDLYRLNPFVIYESHSAANLNNKQKSLSHAHAFFLGEGELIETLLKLNKKVVLFLDLPHLKHNPRDCIQRLAGVIVPTCDITRESYLNEQGAYIKKVYALQMKYPKLKVFDSASIFCDKETCYAKDQNDHYLYFDHHHMTPYASKKVIQSMVSQKYID